MSTSGSTNGVSLRRDYRFAQPMEGRNKEKRFGNNSLPTLFGVINGAKTAHSSQQAFKTDSVYFKHISSLNVRDA